MFKCESLPLEEPAGPRPAARRLELTLGRVSGKDGVEVGVAAGVKVAASGAQEDICGRGCRGPRVCDPPWTSEPARC